MGPHSAVTARVLAGTPIEDQAADSGAAFAGMGIALSDVFYFAQSVLLRDTGAGVSAMPCSMRERITRVGSAAGIPPSAR
jgi:hypothetical protein